MKSDENTRIVLMLIFLRAETWLHYYEKWNRCEYFISPTDNTL